MERLASLSSQLRESQQENEVLKERIEMLEKMVVLPNCMLCKEPTVTLDYGGCGKYDYACHNPNCDVWAEIEITITAPTIIEAIEILNHWK